jgi:hypothetical protein
VIGSLVALLSLDMTRKLVGAGLVATTLAVAAVSGGSPAVVTLAAPHGLVRNAHAVVTLPGVTLNRLDTEGVASADTQWVCTIVDATHLSLSTWTSAGQFVPSIPSGSYSGGGTVKIAFPDGSILLGRRNVAMATAVATPRIVFVPKGSGAWGLDPYGGNPPPATVPRRRSAETAEQKFLKLQPQLATERQRFEVHVTGSATPSDPDFGDFDATQFLYQSLYVSMFNMISPDRGKIIGGSWESQGEEMQSLVTHGQKWVGVVEIAMPVVQEAVTFVNFGTSGTAVVMFTGATSADQIVIVIP